MNNIGGCITQLFIIMVVVLLYQTIRNLSTLFGWWFFGTIPDTAFVNSISRPLLTWAMVLVMAIGAFGSIDLFLSGEKGLLMIMFLFSFLISLVFFIGGVFARNYLKKSEKDN